MTAKNAYFLDFENDQPREISAANIDEFFKSAEVEYKPQRGFFRTIGKILLLLIAPAEYCRSLTEAEREKIGIEI